MTLDVQRTKAATDSHWAAKSLSLRAAHVYTGLVKFKRFTSVHPPSLSLFCIRDDEVVQDDPRVDEDSPDQVFVPTGPVATAEKIKKRERKKKKETRKKSLARNPRSSMVIPKGNLRTVVVIMAGQRPWSLSHTYSDCVCTHPLASRSHEPRRRLCVARLFCLLFREGDPSTKPWFARITGYCRKPDFDGRR